MSLVPSLLHAIVKVDGEAMVMHAGDKPYVVSPTGQVELASRGLTLDAVNGIVGQLLPHEIQAALEEFGAIQYELPAAPQFADEHFTVVAARGGDDLWVEIRRRRMHDDEVPEELFTHASPRRSSPQPQADVRMPSPAPVAAASPIASLAAAPIVYAVADAAPPPVAHAPQHASIAHASITHAPAVAGAEIEIDLDDLPDADSSVTPSLGRADRAAEPELIDDDLALPDARQLWPASAGTSRSAGFVGMPAITEAAMREASPAMAAASIGEGVTVNAAASMGESASNRLADSGNEPTSAGLAGPLEEPNTVAAGQPIAVPADEPIAVAVDEPISVPADEPIPERVTAFEEPLAVAVAASNESISDAVAASEGEPIQVAVATSAYEHPLAAADAVAGERRFGASAELIASPAHERTSDIPSTSAMPPLDSMSGEPAFTPMVPAPPLDAAVSHGDAAVMAAPEPFDTEEPMSTPIEPRVSPIESTAPPPEPPLAPAEPASTPAEPTFAPAEPTFAPLEPAFVSPEPSFAPREPVFVPPQPAFAPAAHAPLEAVASSKPRPIPREPEPVAWQEPTPAVVLPIARSPIRAEGPPPVGQDVTPSALDRLLRLSSARGASTLYLSSESQPSVRVDGELQILDGEPLHTSRDVESLLLTLIPESNHEPFRTGALTEWIREIEGVGRVRCISFRDHRGPGGVFRLMPTRPVSVEQLGLPKHVQALAVEPEGLVLVAGPRSNGKRTLMAAFVDLMKRTRRDHIITIEREINTVHERGSSFISQREVRGDYDDVVAAARGALREDPDVLVIEELRTGPMMNVALDAAASGRLVIAGFAAYTAAGAIDSILHLYPPEQRRQVQFALARSLRGVIVQMLLRKAGGGRLPAREVLLNTPAVSSLIADGKTSHLPMAIEAGRRHGMMPMNEALVGLVHSGGVDGRDAYRLSPDRPALVAALDRYGIDTSFVERLA